MPSIFTRIIDGELPAHLVWKDDLCVAFLSINPLRPGHILVVPRQEIDHWLDLPDDLATHLFAVAKKVGGAIQRAYRPRKVGLMIAGLEVAHTHLHVTPIHDLHDLDFANASSTADPEALEAAGARIREELTSPSEV